MTEFSGLWTTGGAGDGASTYTRAQLSDLFKVLGACMDNEGVAPGYLNACAVSANGANSARVATGGALVDGIMYSNSANVDTNIPSAVGGGNTRIDRLVLRADWTAQTVRVTRIAGTDAASPSAPAITSSAGTTYDLKLAQVLVDTSGTVTITDERVLARPGALSLANSVALGFTNAAGTAINPVLTQNSSDQVAVITAGAGFRIINEAQDTVLVDVSETGVLTLAGSGITAANITNRTRTFFVQPAQVKRTDTNVVGVSQVEGGQMIDGVENDALGYFYCPADYVSGLTVAAAVSPSTTSANIYCQQEIYYAALGESLGTHSGAFAPAAVAITTGQINLIASVSLSSISAGDYVAMRFIRDASNWADTINNLVYFRGWLVSYTADS
jgi:hypothetical protein